MTCCSNKGMHARSALQQWLQLQTGSGETPGQAQSVSPAARQLLPGPNPPSTPSENEGSRLGAHTSRDTRRSNRQQPWQLVSSCCLTAKQQKHVRKPREQRSCRRPRSSRTSIHSRQRSLSRFSSLAYTTTPSRLRVHLHSRLSMTRTAEVQSSLSV